MRKKKVSRVRSAEVRALREKFIKGLKAKARISKAKFREIQRKVSDKRRSLIQKLWNVRDPEKIEFYNKRVSLRRLLQKEIEPEVRVRFRLLKSGDWKERGTKKIWKEVNVRRSIAVKSYWANIKFVAKTAGVKPSEARKLFRELFVPKGIFPEVAGS